MLDIKIIITLLDSRHPVQNTDNSRSRGLMWQGSEWRIHVVYLQVGLKKLTSNEGNIKLVTFIWFKKF